MALNHNCMDFRAFAELTILEFDSAFVVVHLDRYAYDYMHVDTVMFFPLLNSSMLLHKNETKILLNANSILNLV